MISNLIFKDMAQTHSLGNILRVVPVDFAAKTPAEKFVVGSDDFVDEVGFFIRAETAGYITYCPMNNKSDGERITKYFDTSYIFIDPEICRKIFADTEVPVTSPESEAADVIYVGYGV